MDLLASRGIPARILNANAASLAGELPIEASLPQVWIDRDADAARAREAIEEFFKPMLDVAPWRCAKCGEENPPAFDLCWNCGDHPAPRE